MEHDSSIFQEIDDALRADKAYFFWKRYGKLVLAGCVGVVVLTGVSSFWKNHLYEQQMAQTHLMLQAEYAAKEDKYAEALHTLAGETEWTGERAALVKLQTAKLYTKNGETEKAAALYKEVASLGASEDEAIRSSAALQLQAMSGKSSGVLVHSGEAFAVLAKQQEAARLLKEGKTKEAAGILREVLASVPAGTPEYQRTTQLFQLTGESVEK